MKTIEPEAWSIFNNTLKFKDLSEQNQGSILLWSLTGEFEDTFDNYYDSREFRNVGWRQDFVYRAVKPKKLEPHEQLSTDINSLSGLLISPFQCKRLIMMGWNKIKGDK